MNERWKKIASRKWQLEATQKAIDTFHAGGTEFVTNACVGSGKTNHAVALADYMLANDHCDLVIVAVPSIAIRRNFKRTFRTYGRTAEMIVSGEALTRIHDVGVGKKTSALVLTYGALLCPANGFIPWALKFPRRLFHGGSFDS